MTLPILGNFARFSEIPNIVGARTLEIAVTRFLAITYQICGGALNSIVSSEFKFVMTLRFKVRIIWFLILPVRLCHDRRRNVW